MALQVAQRTHQ
uniref:Uncharacterized protein n=1 Tax=Arundo donax TaxID=35708 RepID=A0A0A9C7B7_ARUDO